MNTTSNSSAWETTKEGLLKLITSETFLYILKRVSQAVLTLFLASALSFIIIQLAPGDYVDTLRQNPKISPERIEELKQQFGLNRSWAEQYFLWLWRIFSQGDFGTSFIYQRSVASMIFN